MTTTYSAGREISVALLVLGNLLLAATGGRGPVVPCLAGIVVFSALGLLLLLRSGWTGVGGAGLLLRAVYVLHVGDAVGSVLGWGAASRALLVLATAPCLLALLVWRRRRAPSPES